MCLCANGPWLLLGPQQAGLWPQCCLTQHREAVLELGGVLTRPWWGGGSAVMWVGFPEYVLVAVRRVCSSENSVGVPSGITERGC